VAIQNVEVVTYLVYKRNHFGSGMTKDVIGLDLIGLIGQEGAGVPDIVQAFLEKLMFV